MDGDAGHDSGGLVRVVPGDEDGILSPRGGFTVHRTAVIQGGAHIRLPTVRRPGDRITKWIRHRGQGSSESAPELVDVSSISVQLPSEQLRLTAARLRQEGPTTGYRGVITVILVVKRTLSTTLSTAICFMSGAITASTEGWAMNNTAINVAQYIYDSLGVWVDSWRLQKLTYYAKSWSLAWDGDPIFDEKFEAWVDGPVSKDLYIVRTHKAAKMAAELPGADTSRLSDRHKEVIEAVLAFYGHMSKEELIARTHAEAPWLEARGDLPPKAPSNNLISESAMRRTYSMQSLLGIETPTAPVGSDATETVITDEEIDEQLDKWASTLDWLATR